MSVEVYAKLSEKRLLHPGELLDAARRNRTPEEFWQRANRYTCPLGPDPGVAWVVIKQSDLEDLYRKSATDRNAMHSLKWWYGKTTVEFSGLTICRALTINLVLAGGDGAVRLVELKDKRHLLKMSSLNKQYNVRHPAPAGTSGADLYYADSLNGGSLWTWQTLLSNIWGELPSGASAGSAPSLPYSPDGNPEGFRFIGVNAWSAFHTVLKVVGCTTAYDPLTDTFSIVRLGQTQSGLALKLGTLQDREMFDYNPEANFEAGSMPEKIRVWFMRREKYHGIEKDTPNASNWEMTPAVSKDYSTGITGAVTGTVMDVWSDLPAEFDHTDANTNAAALQTRADEMGANIANRIGNQTDRLSKLYKGAVDTLTTGSQISQLRWRDYGDSTGLVTEVVRRPLEKLQSSSQGGTKSLDEHLTPPDLGRNSWTNYPRTDQLVQVDDGSSATGTELTPNGDGLLDGFVVRWANSAYEQLEPCWIRAADLSGSSLSAVHKLNQGDRLIGRLYGNETSGGTTLPMYLVRKGDPAGSSGDDVKLVEITESDGTIWVNCYTDETRQASDCVFRARIVTRDADTQNLCNRTDVTDGADVWLKVEHAPWCEDMTKQLVGMRFIARKMMDAYAIGENEFPLYEACMEDTRLWSVQPSTDWTGSGPHAGSIHTIDTANSTSLSPTIQDYSSLWSNVINDAGEVNGYGILMGDDFFPLVMRRRAWFFEADIAIAHLEALTTTALTTAATVLSEAPFTDDPGITAENNEMRFAAPTGTKCWYMRDPSSVTGYTIIGVARSDPQLLEIKGSPDGDGEPAQLSGTTSLCVWDARLMTYTATAGSLCSGGGAQTVESDVWFGFAGPTNNAGPYYLTAGQKNLAYDSGQSFTPTGLAARRLYLAERDSETYYGKALENWTDNGSSDDHVDVYPYSPQDDITATDQSHRVYLLKNAQRDPNVVTNDIIAYRLGMDGRWVAVSGYLDDKIGSVKMWAGDVGDVPPGWGVMDGSSNSSANGGSGISMVNKFVRGHSSSAGTPGGEKEHIHNLYVVVEAHSTYQMEASLGDHTHSIDTDNLSIVAHSVSDLEHEHPIGLDTVSNGWPFEYESWTPTEAARLGCTGNPLEADASSCAGAAWGPLTHEFSGTAETGPASGGDAGFQAMSHVTTASYMDPAEHTPEYITLMFIERLDNST